MRIQVNLSEKMVKRVDALAEDMGVSRSAFCSLVIGQYVMNYEKSVDALKSIGLSVLQDEVKKGD